MSSEGTGASGSALPFTGSVLTFPLVVLGLLLTAGGWLLRRVRPAVEDQ